MPWTASQAAHGWRVRATPSESKMHNPDPRPESIGALALCNRVAVTRPKTGPKRVSVEVATLVRWSLTPKHLRDPRGKSVMRTRLERSAQFRALPPSLRETMRTLLAIADAPELGRSGMVHGFAKVEAIAQRRGCSRSQAGRDLARLERLGWIAKAIREPRRFNLGLVFTVFDAPMASAVALVGVPKGPNARSGLGAPMRSPQDGAPMRSPNRGRQCESCLLYTSPSPRDLSTPRMPSSA